MAFEGPSLGRGNRTSSKISFPFLHFGQITCELPKRHKLAILVGTLRFSGCSGTSNNAKMAFKRSFRL